MTKVTRVKCEFCNKQVTKTNLTRHAKTFHLLCPVCLKLEPRLKHKCFGLKLLSQTQWLSINEGKPIYEPCTPANNSVHGQPLTSTIYVPLEIRYDCLTALTACLAARQLLDFDLNTISLFFLAKLQRSCLACMAGREGKQHMQDFHVCRMMIDQIMSENMELTCKLFNIQETERASNFIRAFLIDNSFG